MANRVVVETGARLHFALLDLTGDLGRIDGSIGVALTRPRLVLRACPGRSLKTNMFPDLAHLALQRLNKHYGLHKGLEIEVLESYPHHVGLGLTTQMLLSTAAAYNALYGCNATVRELARIVGRGGTSGVGVAAFEHGGFIFDGGHTFGPGKQKQGFLPSDRSAAPPPPVLFRSPLPRDWIFDVFVPQSSAGLSGRPELEFFRKNCPIQGRDTCKIAHIVLSCILPAVAERDVETFVKGINLLTTLGFKRKEINRQSKFVKRLIRCFAQAVGGSAAVGMSSFGPAIFVIGRLKSRRLYFSTLTRLAAAEGTAAALVHYEARCRNKGATVTIL